MIYSAFLLFIMITYKTHKTVQIKNDIKSKGFLQSYNNTILLQKTLEQKRNDKDRIKKREYKNLPY